MLNYIASNTTEKQFPRLMQHKTTGNIALQGAPLALGTIVYSNTAHEPGGAPLGSVINPETIERDYITFIGTVSLINT